MAAIWCAVSLTRATPSASWNARKPVAHLPLDRIELVRADIRDRDAVEAAVRHCREVYHLAANPNLWTQQRGSFAEVNYQGAVNVLDAALRAGARRVLHTSTESILTLRAPKRRHRPRSSCAPERRGGALLPLQTACRTARFRWLATVLRLSSSIRHCRSVPAIMAARRRRSLLLDFCRGKRHEYLDAELNFIDVRDVAEGMVLAMRHGTPGRRVFTGPRQLINPRGVGIARRANRPAAATSAACRMPWPWQPPTSANGWQTSLPIACRRRRSPASS